MACCLTSEYLPVSSDARLYLVADHTYSGMYSCNELILGGGIEGLPFGGTGPVSISFP